MRYTFNDFLLDTDLFELSKQGQVLSVEPQVIELIALLVENRDRMVTKEEINEKVWRGRIVSETALSSRIKTARQVLGDDGKAQQVIKTIHKKGFRFVANLTDDTPKTGRSSAEHSHSNPSIIVLPFENISNDSEQDYFADGITTDIISMLSKHRWLDVTARNTSFGFKGKPIDIRQLGKTLNVQYVVEGSVRRAGNRVRVNAGLIDASNGHQAWSDRFDREISDIFELQDEITETIVARLEPEIGFAERNKVVFSRPSNLDAWDYYHLGISHFFKFTGPDNLEAQRLLLESQKLDPNFGEAFAWWAYALILGMVYWDTEPSPKQLDSALNACNTALSIDRQNATFYALKARVLLARKEYQQAIRENEMAIALNPSFAAAHCGLGDSLAYEGRYDESLECFDKAISLSPNDPQLWAFLTYGALVQLFKHDYESALEWAERASNIPNCQYWTTAHKVVALAYLDRTNELQKTKQKLFDEKPGFNQQFAKEKLFYLKKQEQIEGYLNGLKLAGID